MHGPLRILCFLYMLRLQLRRFDYFIALLVIYIVHPGIPRWPGPLNIQNSICAVLNFLTPNVIFLQAGDQETAEGKILETMPTSLNEALYALLELADVSLPEVHAFSRARVQPATVAIQTSAASYVNLMHCDTLHCM